MCGILGLVQLERVLDADTLSRWTRNLADLIKHRGPDDQGFWQDKDARVSFAHNRLSIIDLTSEAHQPMVADNGVVIIFNGEIYNYIEIRESLASKWQFKSQSDTETILALYSLYGQDCVRHLRGMFAFAIWDPSKKELFCARDRFGIKPFYFTNNGKIVGFASEAKALLPLLDEIKTNEEAFAEYMVFQYTISSQTLFSGIEQLMPGEVLVIKDGKIHRKKYWTLEYHPDFYHSPKYFNERFEQLVNESIDLHLRSDVPVASYLSGGIDSSIIASLSAGRGRGIDGLYHGRFADPKCDESRYASSVAKNLSKNMDVVDITSGDFRDNISDIIYYLDFPVAGPGSFPQYMVSKKASEKFKVILGGQGGDELFGGYARYLIAYFEQSISAAIDDTYKNGNFVVTPESIIPNLKTLQEYKPLIKQFWKDGVFGSIDQRYFRLVNRMIDFDGEVDIKAAQLKSVEEKFYKIFNAHNTEKASYFDKMTHFDLACLLPALLQVEDRVSMANSLESRVPFLDHELAEFVANIPADIKFKGGAMKHLLKSVFGKLLPEELLNRRDKMGFPVPLNDWLKTDLKDFAFDTFSKKSMQRGIFNSEKIMKSLSGDSGGFSRKFWGFLSFELWYQNFHDQSAKYKKILDQKSLSKKAI